MNDDLIELLEAMAESKEANEVKYEGLQQVQRAPYDARLVRNMIVVQRVEVLVLRQIAESLRKRSVTA